MENNEDNNEISVELLPLQKQVELIHDLRVSDQAVPLRYPGLNISNGQFLLIFKTLAALYMTYYFLLALMLSGIKFMQDRMPKYEGDLSKYDYKMRDWFIFGQYFANFVGIINTIQLMFMVKFDNINRNYFVVLAMFFIGTKMLYYTWVVNGLSLYFQDIRQNQEIKLRAYQSGMLVVTVINIIDIFRAAMAFFSLIILHFSCLFRARRFRTRSQYNPAVPLIEQSYFTDTIMRDLETYYRYRELNRFNQREIKKTFSVKKLIRSLNNSLRQSLTAINRDENICPICCEEMQYAVVMSCDDRHMFHKKCIQLWLLKHRNCPLCKLQII